MLTRPAAALATDSSTVGNHTSKSAVLLREAGRQFHLEIFQRWNED
jgi:hypothetical protein